MHNYARYVRYYIQVLKCIHKNHAGFMDSKKSCIVKNKTGVQATMLVKTGYAMHYKKVLEYPLNSSPLSICHAD